jgi:hypothetical protein
MVGRIWQSPPPSPRPCSLVGIGLRYLKIVPVAPVNTFLYLRFLLAGLDRNQMYGACCFAQTSLNQFEPVQQSRQQAVRAYCPNIYTVPPILRNSRWNGCQSEWKHLKNGPQMCASCEIPNVPGTDYRHTMAKSLILCGPNSNPNPKQIFGIFFIKA